MAPGFLATENVNVDGEQLLHWHDAWERRAVEARPDDATNFHIRCPRTLERHPVTPAVPAEAADFRASDTEATGAPFLETAPADRARLPFKLGYRPEFDSLRGIGMIMVLISHSTWVWPSLATNILPVPGGFQGVDIFFILSGFLLTTLFLEERQRNGRVSFKGFYERRAFRLLPSLFFVLICHFIYIALTGQSIRAELIAIAFIVGYIANFASAYGPTDILRYSFDQTWSLAVEEQYYLFFFPLMLLAFRAIRKFRTFLVLLVVAIAIAFAWRFFLASTVYLDQTGMHIMYVRTDTRLDALLIGPAAALLMQGGIRLTRTLHLLAAAATIYVVSFLYWGDLFGIWLYKWAFTPLEISWGIIIIWLLLTSDNIVHKFLKTRPLVWLGRVSYEVYLWHLPVYIAVGRDLGGGPGYLALALAITFAGASFSFHVVSRPFMRIKRRRALALRGSAVPVP